MKESHKGSLTLHGIYWVSRTIRILKKKVTVLFDTSNVTAVYTLRHQ